MHPKIKLFDFSQDTLTQALSVLQDPSCSSEKMDSPAIKSIIKKTGFFSKIIETPARLQDFLQAAHPHFHYEVFPRGTILTKEKEDTDRFYIILKGTVEKLGQRAFNEVQQEVKDRRGEAVEEVKESEDSDSEPQNFVRLPGKRKTTTNMHRFTSLKLLTIKAGLDTPKDHLGSPDRNLAVSVSKSNVRRTSMIPIFESDLKMEDTEKLNTQNSHSIRNNLLDAFSTGVSNFFINSPTKVEDKTLKAGLSSIIRHAPSRSYGCSQLSSVFQFPLKIENDEEKTEKDKHKGEEPSVVAYERMTREHINFVKLIASKYPEIEGRCLFKNVVRLISTKTYNTGDYFGENFYKERQPKESAFTAVSSQEVHCLTLTRDSYLHIMDELNKFSDEKVQMFRKVFGLLTSEEVSKFSQYFSQKNLKKGETIYNQNDPTKGLYLLRTGDVRLLKEMERTPRGTTAIVSSPRLSKKVEVPVVSIVKHQIFGEELLLNQKVRQYTALANSADTTVYFLEISSYNYIKDTFWKFFKFLQNQAQERLFWREERASDLLEKQQVTTPKLLFPFMQTEGNSLSNSPKLRTTMTSFGDAMQHFEAREDTMELKRKVSEGVLLTPKKILNSSRPGDDGSSVLKNLETYKSKFSRRVPKATKGNSKDKNHEEERSKHKELSPQNELIEFNIRKELQNKYNKIRKLPKIPSNSSLNSPTIKNYIEGSIFTSAVISRLTHSPTYATSKAFDLKKIPILVGSQGGMFDNFVRK